MLLAQLSRYENHSAPASPMEGIEARAFDSGQIIEVALCTAVDQTSVNGVTTNTENTPNREAVVDWLHALEKEPMLDYQRHSRAGSYTERRKI